jgi:beta-phosphoglucomutase-like phosphatase (HAD superfamily)
MRHLRFAALDLDGVVLKDTFSPVIRRMAESLGVEYTREFELEFFAVKPRDVVAREWVERFNLTMSPAQVLAWFFEEKKKHLASIPDVRAEGLDPFLSLLESAGLRLFSYGGLPESWFRSQAGGFAHRFERYVSTDAFRPGMKEITFDICRCRPEEILFVDDIVAVARECRRMGLPFIGIPSTQFQREAMEEAGVRHMMKSICDIDRALLDAVDAAAAAGTVSSANGDRVE